MHRVGVPADVEAIRKQLSLVLNAVAENGKRIGDAQFGVYAFYDFDGEPIYVGQTAEKLRVRIRRHLTNHRTDAVAMKVLDPFEVAEIEMWPLWGFGDLPRSEANQRLNEVEYTVFQQVLTNSSYNAVLNEKDMPRTELVLLPGSLRTSIIPKELWDARKHPDTRLARRADTIASLAKIISERDVSPGLRRTLLTQARRLEKLAMNRFADFANDPIEEDGAN